MILVGIIFSHTICLKNRRDNMSAIKKIDSGKILCLEEKGSYFHLNEKFEKLLEFIKQRRVYFKGEKIGIFYEQPNDFDPNNTHYAAAIELVGETTGDGEITVVIQPSMQVAYENYRGNYTGLRETYTKLLNWIKENNYKVCGPARECYLLGTKFGNSQEDSEYVVELQFPVEKA